MKRMMRIYAVSLALFLMLGLTAATLPQALLAMGKAETPAFVISESQTISETTIYDGGLTIAEGAILSAPEGKNLILTDAGIQKNIAPGTYNGPVVISVTGGYGVNNMGNANLTVINTDIVVSGKSGYDSYADGAILNYYNGSRFQVPDMALIVAAGACGATFDNAAITGNIVVGTL